MSFKSGFVAIIGRPNAGKSTLLNSVLKTELSIVTPKAQTTRDRVLGILSEKQGQIVFVDTPGVHRAKEGGLNEYMVNEAREALEAPNVVWYIVDPSSAPKHEEAVLDLLVHSKAPIILIINKLDWAKKKVPQDVFENLEYGMKNALQDKGIQVLGIRKISALSGDGVEELLQQTWDILPEGPAFYPDQDQISDRPTRFFVAEKIRARLFYLLGEEVPYSCAVGIDSFNETSKPPRIEATIYVERESQKGIVIGKGGKKIKEIGQSAREEIEEFLGQHIFLGLKVKVLKDWSENPLELKKMGYQGPSRSGK